MNIVGICTVCNEADIVEETLTYNCGILDALVVVDCGSTDETREILRKIAAQISNLFLAAELPQMVAEAVRPSLFSLVAPHLKQNDWIAIVDADEFIEENVKEIAQKATRQGADHLFSKHANFYFTQEEYTAWKEGRESVEDRKRSISDRRHFYRMHTSMIRLYRNAPWLRWPEGAASPGRLVKPGQEQVLFRHYQYRDPLQIESRTLTRNRIQTSEEFKKANPHWSKSNWESSISNDSENLREWDGKSPIVADPALPPIPSSSGMKMLAKYLMARLEARRLPPPSTQNITVPLETTWPFQNILSN